MLRFDILQKIIAKLPALVCEFSGVSPEAAQAMVDDCIIVTTEHEHVRLTCHGIDRRFIFDTLNEQELLEVEAYSDEQRWHKVWEAIL